MSIVRYSLFTNLQNADIEFNLRSEIIIIMFRNQLINYFPFINNIDD